MTLKHQFVDNCWLAAQQGQGSMKAIFRNIFSTIALTIGTVGIAFGANPTLNDINAIVDDLLPNGQVQADIDGSIVTLTGYIRDGSIRTEVENRIRMIPGVTGVTNEVTTDQAIHQAMKRRVHMRAE